MTEIIKTKTTHYEVLQVRDDILTFDKQFVDIRKKYKYKGFECFNCNKHFIVGERIGLMVTNKGNKTVCNGCAKEFAKKLRLEVGK